MYDPPCTRGHTKIGDLLFDGVHHHEVALSDTLTLPSFSHLMHHIASHGQEFVVFVGRLAIVGHRLPGSCGRLPLLVPQLLLVLLFKG